MPWVIAWALVALTVLSLPSFGLFIGPVALLALAAASYWGGDRVAGAGFALGVGLMLVIGLGNPCPTRRVRRTES